MSELVLDASVALRWILDVELPPLAIRVRELLNVVAGRAIVPALWHWEVANSLVLAERRTTPIPHGFEAARGKFTELAAIVHTDTLPPATIPATAEVARRFGLTAYDAAYLELALRLEAPLATLDRQLRQAAILAGVAVDF